MEATTEEGKQIRTTPGISLGKEIQKLKQNIKNYDSQEKKEPRIASHKNHSHAGAHLYKGHYPAGTYILAVIGQFAEFTHHCTNIGMFIPTCVYLLSTI